MTSIPELTAAIEALEATWNGIDQAPACELRRLRRERAALMRDGVGCCGESYELSVECVNSEGVKVDAYTLVKCNYTGLVCQHKAAGFGSVDAESLTGLLAEIGV